LFPQSATKSHIVNENKYKGRQILTLVHHVAAIWITTQVRPTLELNNRLTKKTKTKSAEDLKQKTISLQFNYIKKNTNESLHN
jgi:UTP-glucose-1-phosphate uridylyltransferase